MNEENVLSKDELKEINNQILDNLSFKNLIPINVLDQSQFIYIYLDFDKDYTCTKEDKPEKLIIKNYQKVGQMALHKIEIPITQEQLHDIKKIHNFGINLYYNLFLNETLQYLTKQFISKINDLGEITYRNSFTRWNKLLNFLYKIFKKKYIKYIKIKDYKDLIILLSLESYSIGVKSRYGCGNYIICNSQTATILSDLSEFKPSGLSKYTENCFGQMYLSGNIRGISVYVDPNMKWADTSILIGRKINNKQEPGLNFIFNQNGTIYSIMEKGRGASKTVLEFQSNFIELGNHPEYNYSKIVYKLKK